jgi:hypothetical protein
VRDYQPVATTGAAQAAPNYGKAADLLHEISGKKELTCGAICGIIKTVKIVKATKERTMKVYEYLSKHTGRNYNIEKTAKGWTLSEWSHGDLANFATKREAVAAMKDLYEHMGKDGSGRICDEYGNPVGMAE